MQDDIKNTIARVFAGALLALILVVGFIFTRPEYLRARALRERDAELQQRIDAKRREIAVLVENQRRFKTDRDFVESIARRNKRVYPGELVFVFED